MALAAQAAREEEDDAMKRIWQAMSGRGSVALVLLTAALAVGLGVRLGRSEPVPRTFAYQGVLTDADGSPVSGTHEIAVSLYPDAVTDPALCTETEPAVPVSNGLFRLVIGDGGGCAVDPSWFSSGTAVHLGLVVDGEALSPRVPLLPVGIAFQAEHAETAATALQLIRRQDDAEISVGGLYCGSSSPVLPGSLGGYSGAKAICETRCGSPAAHMCSADEMVRSWQLDIDPGYGWYASGLYAVINASGAIADDCVGWTVGASVNAGPAPLGRQPSASGCEVAKAILCCL